jgi:hypothetical protein
VTATWTPEHARDAHRAAREDLARRVASEQAVTLALRRVRAAFMADNGWSQGRDRADAPDAGAHGQARPGPHARPDPRRRVRRGANVTPNELLIVNEGKWESDYFKLLGLAVFNTEPFAITVSPDGMSYSASVPYF